MVSKFQGTSTGNTYVAGRSYTSAGRTYIANESGTFTRDDGHVVVGSSEHVSSSSTAPIVTQADTIAALKRKGYVQNVRGEWVKPSAPTAAAPPVTVAVVVKSSTGAAHVVKAPVTTSGPGATSVTKGSPATKGPGAPSVKSGRTPKAGSGPGVRAGVQTGGMFSSGMGFPKEQTIVFIGGHQLPIHPGTSDAGDIEDARGEGEFMSPTWFYNWAAELSHWSYAAPAIWKDSISRDMAYGSNVVKGFVDKTEYVREGLSKAQKWDDFTPPFTMPGLW